MKSASPRLPGQKFRAPWDRTLARSAEAIERDPDNIAAHLDLADALMTLHCFGFLSHEEAWPRALASAERAVALDPFLPKARMILGIVRMSGWDWAAAERELQSAVSHAGHEAVTHHWYGLYLSAIGQHHVALAELRKAAALRPGPGRRVGLAAGLYFAHQFDEMARVLEAAVEESPESAPCHDWLGMAYVQLGRFDDSIRVYRRAVELADGAAEVRAGLGHACALAGRADEARAVLDELIADSARCYVPPAQIAYVAFGLNETDQGFDLLERAHRQKAWELVFAREEPWFDHLRRDPRFTDIIDRLNLPWRDAR